jgi:hypothetical protein
LLAEVPADDKADKVGVVDDDVGFVIELGLGVDELVAGGVLLVAAEVAPVIVETVLP